MEYLDFEAPIREMDEQLERTRAMAEESGLDMTAALEAE
jgi:acetyl-CoA carboxylase carboxyl transferase subunit alpha